MRYFCTYFDHNFLTRALVLYDSLREHSSPFKIWMLCFDNEAYATLTRLNLPDVIPIALDDFERDDSALRAAKDNRSKIEYYFTCTPTLPRYVLTHNPEVDLIAYVDADLRFFSDLSPIYAAFESHSSMLIPHRFPPKHKEKEEYGLYNVQYLLFRRDENGLAALNWYYQQCVDWCYDRLEGECYADQKYLDQFPHKFDGVLVLDHLGAGLAPWNIGNYRLHRRDGSIWVNDYPLIFYHYHGFRFLRHWLMKLQLHESGAPATRSIVRWIYLPYARELVKASHRLGLPDAADKIARAWGDYQNRWHVLRLILQRELVLIVPVRDRVFPLI